jgi:hypothetical protein
MNPELARLIQEDDPEIIQLIQQPEPDPDNDDNNGRVVHPVLRPVQPRVFLAPGGRQRDNIMPLNGGQKKKRTSKNSRKYKNKNHKNKNRKHQTRKTRKTKRVIKNVNNS